MDKMGWFLVLLLFLAACVSSAEPTATPFSIQRIAIAPELEGLITPWLVAYVEEFGQADLKVELISPKEILPALEADSVDLGLISQEVPDGWFATPIYREAIAVIVHPGVELVSLELNDLADIFSGRIKSWEIIADSSGPIQPVVPLPGCMIREKFAQVIMGNSPFDPSAIVAGTPDAIVGLVESRPGAIGILPLWRVEEGVGVVGIAGVMPQEETVKSGVYPLWIDIVAVAPEEPVGHLREFLVWLQGSYLP